MILLFLLLKLIIFYQNHLAYTIIFSISIK
nr:MAG TPA: hypothetical protein [Caudoviricetes sp.]